MIDHEKLGKKAREIIKLYGFLVYLSKKNVSPDETIDYGKPITGYALELKNKSNFAKGSIIEGSHRFLTVIDEPPELGDIIATSVESLTVIAVDAVRPGGVVLYYEVYAR